MERNLLEERNAPRQVCIDANIVLKLVLDEPNSDMAHKLWRKWLEEEAELLAPPLFVFEGVSAI